MRLKQCSIINSITYRGDTRPPEEIFSNGFWNRQTPESQWLQVLNGGSEDVVMDLDIDGEISTDHLSANQLKKFEDPSIPKACDPLRPGRLAYRIWVKSDPRIYVTIRLHTVEGISSALWEHYIHNLPVYREDKDDISPKTAVCFTLRPHVAPYFPIDGCTRKNGEWIWVYAVVLGAAYKTYAYQKKRGSSLAEAQEVAVEHVASNHVLCAVRCWRKGKYPDMSFLLAPRICWNPSAGGERMLCKNEILTAFNPYQSYEATCRACAVTARTRNSIRVLQEPMYPYWLWQR